MKFYASDLQFQQMQTDKIIQEKSCGIVIYRQWQKEIKFLLLHYPNGHWDFPKGHVEKGEQEEETARRETKEETGIHDIQFEKKFRQKIEYTYQREKQVYRKEVIFFLAKTETKEIEISHEHQNHIWLRYEEALKKLTFENAREVLKKTQQFLQDQL